MLCTIKCFCFQVFVLRLILTNLNVIEEDYFVQITTLTLIIEYKINTFNNYYIHFKPNFKANFVLGYTKLMV